MSKINKLTTDSYDSSKLTNKLTNLKKYERESRDSCIFVEVPVLIK